ncbi:MAG: GNAT family N-acetyltransferase [Patescibacteria group bacterium]
MSQNLTFRPANLNDIPTLRHWDLQEHVLRATHYDYEEQVAAGKSAEEMANDWEWEEVIGNRPDWLETIIAERDGQPIGVMQVIDPATESDHYWGDIGLGYRAIDIWIGDLENTNKGYGTEMMTWMINHCFENPSVHSIIIDPLINNTRAIQFYQKLGFKFVEDRWFDTDLCAVHILSRQDWKSNSL